MSELLPCAHCGGNARLEKKGNSISHYVVLCDGCRVKMVGTEADDAVNAWNRRTQPPQPQAEADDLRERLAEYAHEAWSGWMKYMLSKCEYRHQNEPDGPRIAVIPAESLEHWQRQMNTPYADLPENEKESDRKEADEMLAILRRRPQGDAA